VFPVHPALGGVLAREPRGDSALLLQSGLLLVFDINVTDDGSQATASTWCVDDACGATHGQSMKGVSASGLASPLDEMRMKASKLKNPGDRSRR
jgi:hypothetical protein